MKRFILNFCLSSLFFLSLGGCASGLPAAEGLSASAPVAVAAPVANLDARINAPEIIQALESAGCAPDKFTLSESKRQSTLAVKCRNTFPAMPPGI